MRPAALAAAAATPLWLASAAAQPPEGIAALGETIASNRCADCHRALPDEQDRVGSGAISFWEIATDPTQTLDDVRAFLATPNPVMPFHSLTADDRDALIAYMRYLGGDGAR